MFVILVHVCSCLWITIGYLDTENQGWIFYYTDEDTSIGEIYLTSYYFNLVSVLTIGYGDIIPRTKYERLLNLFMMIFGIGTYSFLITTLSGVFGKMDLTEATRQSMQDILDSFDEEYGLNSDLYYRIRETININLHQNIVGFNDVLDSLPFSVRTDLLLKMHRKNIANLPIFKNKARDFILHILPLLRPTRFFKGEYICNIEEILEEMFMIVSGILSITLGKKFLDLEIFELKKNMNFGDVLFYMNMQCPYDVVCKKDTEVLILNKMNFLATKSKFNESMLSILEEDLKIMYKIEMRRKVYVEIFHVVEKIPNAKSLIKKAAEVIDFNFINEKFNLVYYNDNYCTEEEISFYSKYLSYEHLGKILKDIIFKGTKVENINKYTIFQNQNCDVLSVGKLEKMLQELEKEQQLLNTSSSSKAGDETQSPTNSPITNKRGTEKTKTRQALKDNIMKELNGTMDWLVNSPVTRGRTTKASIIEERKEIETQQVAKKILQFALINNGFGKTIKNKKMSNTFRGSLLYNNKKVWKKLVLLFFDPLSFEIEDFKQNEKLKQLEQLNESKLNFIKIIINFDEKDKKKSESKNNVEKQPRKPETGVIRKFSDNTGGFTKLHSFMDRTIGGGLDSNDTDLEKKQRSRSYSPINTNNSQPKRNKSSINLTLTNDFVLGLTPSNAEPIKEDKNPYVKINSILFKKRSQSDDQENQNCQNPDSMADFYKLNYEEEKVDLSKSQIKPTDVDNVIEVINPLNRSASRLSDFQEIDDSKNENSNTPDCFQEYPLEDELIKYKNPQASENKQLVTRTNARDSISSINSGNLIINKLQSHSQTVKIFKILKDIRLYSDVLQIFDEV